MNYAIESAQPWHIGQILRRIRKNHLTAINATLGRNAHVELKTMFEASASFRRVAIVDGRLLAMWGVTGSLLNHGGHVWLILTQEATQYPLAIIKEAKRQIQEMMITRDELATTVLDSDFDACNFAAFLGFHVHHNSDVGDRAYTRLTRYRLVNLLTQEGPWRVPIGRLGQGKASMMGYH